MEEKVTLIVKRKSIQIIFEYAMDLKIPFQVIPRGISIDEFEIDLTINGIKQAVALGMFVKENKFDVSGLGELAKSKASTANKKIETKESSLSESVSNNFQTEEHTTLAVLNF